MVSTLPPPIRVFVVDDHPMVRDGLAAMVRAEPGLEWVGETGLAAEAATRAATSGADVVLMDLVMPDLDGIEATEMLRQRVPSARVIVLTTRIEPPDVRRAVEAGASGYLDKTCSARELVGAIRDVHAGRRGFSAEAGEALRQAGQALAGADLTAREREVLLAIVDGMTNHQIARALAISLPTVKYHVTNVFAKLQVHSRTEAAMVAVRLGIARAS